MEPSSYRPVVQSARSSGRTTHPPADAARNPSLDKRSVFKQMVVSQLEAGFLRYSQRTSLLRFARQIGISEFDATLLIAEAQFYADQIEPLAFETPLPTPDHEAGGEWSQSSGTLAWRLMFAVAVALLIDLLAVYWLTA